VVSLISFSPFLRQRRSFSTKAGGENPMESYIIAAGFPVSARFSVLILGGIHRNRVFFEKIIQDNMLKYLS